MTHTRRFFFLPILSADEHGPYYGPVRELAHEDDVPTSQGHRCKLYQDKVSTYTLGRWRICNPEGEIQSLIVQYSQEHTS